MNKEDETGNALTWVILEGENNTGDWYVCREDAVEAAKKLAIACGLTYHVCMLWSDITPTTTVEQTFASPKY